MKFTIDNPRLLARFADALDKNLDAALRDIGDIGVEIVKRSFRDSDAVASGKTRDSITRDQEPIRQGSLRTIRIFPEGDRARIVRFIENGRSPGAAPPPTEAIVEWLRHRKLDQGLSDSALEGLAFIIARSIGERGIAGKKIFAKAKTMVDRLAEERVAKAVRAALNAARSGNQ